MIIARSATPIERIQIEPNGMGGSDVWLHRAIADAAVEDANGTQVFQEAEEVHGTVQGIPTAEEIGESFDEWWDALEEASLTDAERFERLEAQVLFTALMTETEV